MTWTRSGLALLAMGLGCTAPYPAPGDLCADAGQVRCGAISTNRTLLMECTGGTYNSVGTCPRGTCLEPEGSDHLFCDQLAYAILGTECLGKQGFACAAGDRSVLRCGADDWVVATRCEGYASCGRGSDGGYACVGP